MIDIACRSEWFSIPTSMRTCSQILWGAKVLRDGDVEDIWGGIGVVGYSGMNVRPMDEARIPVGIITQESASFRGQPGIPLCLFGGVQVTRHEDEKAPAKVRRKVRGN